MDDSLKILCYIYLNPYSQMKKLIIALSILTFFSCEDSLSDKIPAFEARVNGTTQWVAENYIASIENNQLTITGNNPFGVISMSVTSPEVDDYSFYSWSDNYAIFQDTLQYSTQNDGIGSVAYLGEGFIDIHQIDNVNNTISGHFHFDAYNGTGEFTINISEGVFYRIPINSANQD